MADHVCKAYVSIEVFSIEPDRAGSNGVDNNNWKKPADLYTKNKILFQSSNGAKRVI